MKVDSPVTGQTLMLLKLPDRSRYIKPSPQIAALFHLNFTLHCIFTAQQEQLSVIFLKAYFATLIVPGFP